MNTLESIFTNTKYTLNNQDYDIANINSFGIKRYSLMGMYDTVNTVGVPINSQTAGYPDLVGLDSGLSLSQWWLSMIINRIHDPVNTLEAGGAVGKLSRDDIMMMVYLSNTVKTNSNNTSKNSGRIEYF